jgi:hypothetical protein
MSFAKETEQTHSHENILVNFLLSRDVAAIVSSGWATNYVSISKVRLPVVEANCI